MAQCPHCKTTYEQGQRYCSVCGSFLMHPEDGDHFCPECGIRISPKQEFCHECDAPVKGPAAASKAAEPEAPAGAPAAAPQGMSAGVKGLLIAAGVVILLLVIILMNRTSAPPPPAPPAIPKAAAPAPQPAVPAPTPAVPAPAPVVAPPAAPATPPAPPAAAPATTPELRGELLNVLSGMREGHLRKDIVLYMSTYSLTFPGLDDKRRNTLNNWENFDYTNLVFTLDEIQPIDADNVVGRATWYIDTRNRRNQELSSAKQSYEIRFAKEQGKWRIRSLKEMEE